MNTSTTSSSASNGYSSSGSGDSVQDEIDLSEVFYTLLDHKKTIALIAAVVFAIGLTYALLTTPIYESNILVQVEDSQKGIGGNLVSEASSLFDVKTDASAEIEILKSRMIAQYPVEQLGLNITTAPRYFPLVGKGIARWRDDLGEPGLFGMGGYAWGAESIKVGKFVLPNSRTNLDFKIMALGNQRYALIGPVHGSRFEGEVGKTLALSFDGKAGYAIRVDSLQANPGTVFMVSARSRLAEMAKLQAGLKIQEMGKQSGVISVGMQGADPQRIAAILNSVAEIYVRQNIERKTEEAANSLSFLTKQLPELKKELEGAEAQYNQYRNQRGIIDLGEEAKALLDQTTSAQSKLAELRQRQQELSTRYLADHPNMQAIQAMLTQAQAEADRVNVQIKRLPLVEQDAVRLTRDMKVSTDLYANLLQTTQQLRLVKAGKVGTVRLIDAAVVPERPIAPKKSLIVAAALMLGLMLGCAFVLVRKAMRGAIETAEQVEQITGLPVFASVPHSDLQAVISQDLGAKKKSDLLAKVSQSDPAIESLRSFYTAMQFATLGARNNITLITGPTQGVGKSFVAVNYAAVLAAAGKRVLLLDADIRKGYLHKYFGFAQKPGLSELLAGTAELKDTLHAQALPGLDLISCGTYPPNPTELLRRPQLEQFLHAQSQLYDHIVVDAAPVLPVTDPLILGSHVGATILVVKEGLSTNEEIIEITKRTQQAGVAITGFLLNDMQQNKSRYRYGYKYGYAYTYGGQATPAKRGLGAALKKWF